MTVVRSRSVGSRASKAQRSEVTMLRERRLSQVVTAECRKGGEIRLESEGLSDSGKMK
jgi:hypothetical protein